MANRLQPIKIQTLIQNRLFKNGVWAISSKVIVLPLGLLISALLARVLSPENMGTYIFAQSIVLSGVVIAQLGLGPTAVRTIAASLGIGDLASVSGNVRNLLVWGLVGAIVTAIFVNLLSNFIGIDSNIVLWVSLWIVVLACQKLLAEILRGFHDIRSAALIGDASAGGVFSYSIVAISLLIFWSTLGEIQLTTALSVTIIAGTAAILLALIILIKTVRNLNVPKGGKRHHFSWKILYAALPVLIHTIANQVQNQSGIWMLEAFQSSSEVAQYGVAARLVALITVPLSVVNSVISPIIPDLYWQGKKDKLEKTLRGLTTLSTIPAMLILFIFWVAGPFIMEFLYGEFYRSASNILIILTIGVVFNVMAGSSGLTLLMTGHQRTLMGISIFSGLITIIGVYYAAIMFGTVGVATVVSISLLFKNLLMIIYTRRLLGIWTHASPRIDYKMLTDILS